MHFLSTGSDPKDLFNLISEGSEAAFKILFEQYKSKTYAVAFKWTKCEIAAEEIIQEVFINIWISRAQLKMVNDPVAYIYTVIYNNVKRYLKKEENRKRILQLALWDVKKISNETEEAIYANDSQQLINQALATLTPQKKLIYNLSRQQGHSCAEISQSLNLSRHTVKSHLVQATKLIRKYMENVTILLIVVCNFL